MECIEEQKTNLFRLITTLEDKNVSLAFEIIKGNNDLKVAAVDRYIRLLAQNVKVKHLNILLIIFY